MNERSDPRQATDDLVWTPWLLLGQRMEKYLPNHAIGTRGRSSERMWIGEGRYTLSTGGRTCAMGSDSREKLFLGDACL